MNWIRYNKDLPRKPEVLQMARHCGMSAQNVCGWLMEVWSWADSVTRDGVVDVTLTDVQHATMCPEKVLAAMRLVGWIVESPDGISFPNFDRYNTETAKKREQSRKRQQEKRARDKDSVTRDRHANVTQMSRVTSRKVSRKMSRLQDSTGQNNNKGETATVAKATIPAPPDRLLAQTLSSGDDGLPVTPTEFVARWNAYAKDKPKLKQVRSVNKERSTKIRNRLKQPGWFADFCECLLLLPIGGDDWQPGLDWLIRNEQNVSRILEGEFDWKAETPAAKRLQEQKRRNAAKWREQRVAQEKRQVQAEAQATSQALRGAGIRVEVSTPDDAYTEEG